MILFCSLRYIISNSFLSNSLLGTLEEINISKHKQNKVNTSDIGFEIKSQKKNDYQLDSRLEIRGLEKSYDNKLVLNNLSFTAYQNEIFTILDSGSILYKLTEDDTGNEVLNPKGIKTFRKLLGVCPKNNNILYDDLTVKENLEIFCLFKYNKKENGSKEKYFIENEVEDLLKNYDLEDKKDILVKNLSGRYKRKLGIAIACCGRSKVIILDEPTGGIDILSKKKFWKF